MKSDNKYQQGTTDVLVSSDCVSVRYVLSAALIVWSCVPAYIQVAVSYDVMRHWSPW